MLVLASGGQRAHPLCGLNFGMMNLLNSILLFIVSSFNRVIIPRLTCLGVYYLTLLQDLPGLIDTV